MINLKIRFDDFIVILDSYNISIVAVKETSKLEDNAKQFPKAHMALIKNSYVDNIFHEANTMEELEEGIKEIELVTKKGGFKFKDWIVSCQKIPEQVISVKLPNAIDLNKEKALGIFWDVEQDNLYIKPFFNDKLPFLIKPSSKPPSSSFKACPGEGKRQP